MIWVNGMHRSNRCGESSRRHHGCSLGQGKGPDTVGDIADGFISHAQNIITSITESSDESQESCYSIDMLRGLSRSGWQYSDGVGRYHISPALRSTILHLLRVPYFSRTWIVPEILQARDLRFLMGRTSTSTALRQALRLIKASLWKDEVQHLVRISHLLESREEPEPGVPPLQRSVRDVFMADLQFLHDTSCSGVRDKIFAAMICPGSTSLAETDGLKPDYTVTIDELVVTVISHFDRLTTEGKVSVSPFRDELSRTLARSLVLCNEKNTTLECELAVVASIKAGTHPWQPGQPLLMRSGREIINPGPYLMFYLESAVSGAGHVSKNDAAIPREQAISAT